MNKKILINSTINEVRIAITEDNKLAEYFIDLPDKEKLLGNIYLGKVNRIVQGLNAAFHKHWKKTRCISCTFQM